MSNELYHWGIKGMHWGVRRFQNKDGSLTQAGKKRYNDIDGGDSKNSSGNNNNHSQSTSSKPTSSNSNQKSTQDMSDEDYRLALLESRKQRVLNTHSADELYKNKDLFDDKELMNAYLRLNTERNIKNLIPEKVSKGQQFINMYTGTSKTIKSVMDSTMDLYKSYEKGMELLNKLNAKTKTTK